MPRPRERATLERLVAAALAVQLTASFGGVVALRTAPTARPTAPLVRGRVAPSAALDRAREAAVQALLDTRAKAVTEHDRAAWLSTVDLANPDFVRRQAALFDALSTVPVRDWSYRLDPAASPPANVDLDRTRGPGWWSPGVTLTYRIDGYDDRPTAEPQRLTFVPRGGRWLLAADDDFAAAGRDTTRGLWDFGPVTAVRGTRSIVLGHPRSKAVMRQVADAVDAAVPRVTAVWGAWAQRVVVLVPSSQAELAGIVGGHGDYTQIAAVATAELVDPETGYHPVGDRIVINPPTFAKLGAIGRRVVLTHEVTHVATRAATGNVSPAWLVEGLADYVGYLGVGLPYRLSASELRDAVRRGRVPSALPSEKDYDGGNRDLAAVYEQGWLAVSLLAEQHGRAGLLRFYRAVGASDLPTAVDDALADLWVTDLATFTAQWRRDLTTRLR